VCLVIGYCEIGMRVVRAAAPDPPIITAERRDDNADPVQPAND